MSQCLVHILDTNKATKRIDNKRRCYKCNKKIIGSITDSGKAIRWITWDSCTDTDPDNMFGDIRAKYYAFIRLKSYPKFNITYTKNQKEFVKAMNHRMIYWLTNPLTEEEENTNKNLVRDITLTDFLESF